MRILNAAKCWELNPDDVCKWSIVDFMDREEYMDILADMKPNNNEDHDDREDWPGPNNG